MTADLPIPTISCTQCGGELHPDEGQSFLTCPYCSATVYLDKSQVVFHWYLAPTLNEKDAQGSLARWMAGNETVKDLDQKARVEPPAFEYFPLWMFKLREKDGREKILLEPAAATSVSEIRRLNLPAGDLRKYDPDIDSQAHLPNIPLDTAMGWLAERGLSPGEVTERTLVHIPLYTFKYTYNGRPYTALVEAGTGGVFANLYPAKAEAPYRLAGCLTGLVFLCLALIPIIGAATNENSGTLAGLGICTGLGILAAPALFALAVWVAAKV